jgi:putative photosynthetic complex assembly protein 2
LATAAAISAAILVWLASTGVILWRVASADAVGLPAHRRSVVLSLPVMVVGLWGYTVTLGEGSVAGAYGAFLSAIAIWGWIELAFLSGVVTGPSREPPPPGARGPRRFLAALATVAYRQVLVVVTLAALVHVGLGAANPFGLLTFALLVLARVCAEVNFFLGVPRIHSDLLPGTLAHLDPHFRRARHSAFWVVSVAGLAALTLAAAFQIPGSEPWAAAGWTLLATLTALALLEHLLMVLRLPDDRVWRWFRPSVRPGA